MTSLLSNEVAFAHSGSEIKHDGELVKDVFPWSERGAVDCPSVTVMSGERESVKDVFPWSERGAVDSCYNHEW